MMLREGLLYKQMAQRRGVGLSTVRTLLHTAYRKLGVRSAAQCVALMAASGWCDEIDTDFRDVRLTASQTLYLAAFERWLRDPCEERADERQFWLRGIYHEARLTPPWERLGIPRRPRRGLGIA